MSRRLLLSLKRIFWDELSPKSRAVDTIITAETLFMGLMLLIGQANIYSFSVMLGSTIAAAVRISSFEIPRGKNHGEPRQDGIEEERSKERVEFETRRGLNTEVMLRIGSQVGDDNRIGLAQEGTKNYGNEENRESEVSRGRSTADEIHSPKASPFFKDGSAFSKSLSSARG